MHILKKTAALSTLLLAGILSVQASDSAHLESPNWDKISESIADDASEDTPGFQLEEYFASTPLNASYRLVLEVFKRPTGLGVTKEFALVSIDGELKKIFVVSTAKNGKYTIEGDYELKVMKSPGKKSAVKKPYPWKTSATYNNSPMYWGLQIKGGYWIHSTPHYGDLGKPASMGCVRMHFPASMYIFDQVVNELGESAAIKIYGSGTARAKEAFAAHKLDAGWVNDRLAEEVEKVLEISKKDYEGVGHAWKGEKFEFPSCLDVDCFDYFGKKKPATP